MCLPPSEPCTPLDAASKGIGFSSRSLFIANCPVNVPGSPWALEDRGQGQPHAGGGFSPWPGPAQSTPCGVGCSECLRCPQSSDAAQCSPLFLSSWFLQGSRGSPAASTGLQAPRGRTERECVRPQSQPETGEDSPKDQRGGQQCIPRRGAVLGELGAAHQYHHLEACGLLLSHCFHFLHPREGSPGRAQVGAGQGSASTSADVTSAVPLSPQQPQNPS